MQEDTAIIDAFSLWGKLQADTGQFDRAIAASELKLKAAGQAVDQLERKARSLGDHTQTTGRTFDKFNDTISNHRDRLAAATAAYQNGDISGKKYASVVASTANNVEKLNSRLADQKAKLADMPGHFRDLISVVGGAGAAIAGFAIRSSMELDGYRNRLTAMLGDAGKANAKFSEILNLARQSVGVSVPMALDAYAQIKAIGTVGEQSIMKLIGSLGKLDIAFQIPSMQQFTRNLSQLFNENFKMQDWKEALGQVPIFGQLVEKAFGTQDLTKLRQLKQSGKITLDAWIDGLSEAIANDSRLAGLQQTFQTRLNRLWSEIKLVSADLGGQLEQAIRPTMDKVIAELQAEKPNFSKVGQTIGEDIGKGISEGIINGVKNGGQGNGNWFDQLKDWIVNQGGGAKPLAKGLFSGLGYTPDFSGLKAALNDAFKAVVDWNSRSAEAIKGGLRAWAGIVAFSAPIFVSAAYNIGSNIVQGVVNGISNGATRVAAAVRSLISSHLVGEAKGQLGIQSPSKVFTKIGENIGEGLIIGIDSMTGGVAIAMDRLLGLDKLKSVLVNKDTDGGIIQAIEQLVNSFNDLRGVSVQEQAIIDTTVGKYKNATQALKDYYIALAKQYSLEQARIDFLQKHPLEADPNAAENTGGRAPMGDGELAAPPPDDSPLNLGYPPKIKAQWSDFWATMMERLNTFKGTLPSLKAALGDNLISSIERIGDVFGSALNSWLTHSQSFFGALRQGFSSLISSIISELVRLMVMRAVLSLIGSFAGGGSLFGGGGGSVANGAHIGHAAGGYISGDGTGTSDSIPARLSNGEYVMKASAVSKWGKGFFDNLNAMSTPMAFAGGGYASTTTNTSYAPVININVTGSAASGQTHEQITRAVLKAMQMAQKRSK